MSEDNVKLKNCPTKDMIADMLTKELSKDQFIKLRKMAGVTPMNICLAASEEC